MGPPLEFDTGLALSDLDPEHPRPIETPWGTMALYRLGEEVLCVQAFCPHMEGPLFQGTLSPLVGPGGVRGPAVTCPWHHWCYDLRSGVRLDPPMTEEPRGDPLVRCEVARGPGGTILLRPPAS